MKKYILLVISFLSVFAIASQCETYSECLLSIGDECKVEVSPNSKFISWSFPMELKQVQRCKELEYVNHSQGEFYYNFFDRTIVDTQGIQGSWRMRRRDNLFNEAFMAKEYCEQLRDRYLKIGLCD